MVLFNIVAVVSLRWFATAAAAGPSSITLWVLAALLFFVPQGLAVSDLSARYPDEGGIYAWTKRAFGEGHGFLCGWCYWVNNILYYPNLLMSTAVVGTYVIGRGADRPGGQLDLRASRHAGGALAGRGAQHRRRRARDGGCRISARSAPTSRASCSSGSALTPRSPSRRPRRSRAQRSCPTSATVRAQPVGVHRLRVRGPRAVRRDGWRGEGSESNAAALDPASRLRSSPSSTSPARRRCSGSCRPAEVNIVSGFLQALRAGARDIGWRRGLDPGGRGGALRPRQHRRRRRLAHRAGPRGVRDRARPLLPAGLRPGAPAMADAVRRDPHPGGARDASSCCCRCWGRAPPSRGPTSSFSTRCCWCTSSPTSTSSSASGGAAQGAGAGGRRSWRGRARPRW